MKIQLSLLLLLSFLKLYSQYNFYPKENSNLFVQEAIQTTDGGYVIVSMESCYTPGGTVTEGCINAIFTVKTNSFGDTIWTNRIGDFFTQLEPDIRVFENNDSSITIFSTRPETIRCNEFTGQPPFQSWHRIDVMNIDSNGNFIDQFHLTDNCYLSYTDIRHLDDDSYLIVANYSEYVPIFNEQNSYNEGRVFIINKRGDILSEYNNPYERFRSGKIISNDLNGIRILYMRGDNQLVLNSFDSELNLVSSIVSVENFPHCLDYNNCGLIQASLNENNEIIILSKNYGTAI